MRNANNKVQQLFTALNCGFIIPCTLLTNNAFALNGFIEDKNEVIIKPIKSTIVTDTNSTEMSLKTSLNKADLLQEQIKEFADFSLFTQSKINKIADVRVTVLNKTIIACKIDTSTLPQSEVDWRPNTFDFNHTIIELPKTLEQSIFRYMEAMNIRSGYFDFGLDSTGNFWFFECNPNAQWFWIELKTGFKISFEIAKQLIATKKSNK
jgi:glutathione synthase/RimK-type ligase-like ATP-grasp enzyme